MYEGCHRSNGLYGGAGGRGGVCTREWAGCGLRKLTDRRNLEARHRERSGEGLDLGGKRLDLFVALHSRHEVHELLAAHLELDTNLTRAVEELDGRHGRRARARVRVKLSIGGVTESLAGKSTYLADLDHVSLDETARGHRRRADANAARRRGRAIARHAVLVHWSRKRVCGGWSVSCS